MDTDLPQILCTKIDEHSGAWPSESFVSLFRTARKCVEPKMHSRPEIHEVTNTNSHSSGLLCLCVHTRAGIPRAGAAGDNECQTVC